MRSSKGLWQLAGATGLALVAWATATGCQTYDFEPVTPQVISQSTQIEEIVARDRRPNVMLLVDTSASMRLPIDPSLPECQYGDAGVCGEPGHADCDPGTCPSRWSELQGSISNFLADAGTLARYGLATFPGEGNLPDSNLACVPSRTVDVGITHTDSDEPEAELQARADSVRDALLGIHYSDPDPAVRQTRGGTPTGGSLHFMGRLGDLRDQQRSNFVLLLTDGLPNCNPANAHSAEDDPVTCQCTLEGGSGCFGDTARVGCLDKDATIATLADNAGPGRQIRTVVVGFGAETGAPEALDTLNAMAEAGGLARSCANGGSCSVSETCDPVSQLCERRYYQANNGTELATVLDDISKRLSVRDPCRLTLYPEDYPDSPDLLVVTLDGETLAAGADSWELIPEGVQFLGSACDHILASTPDDPAVIQVRTIRRQ